jgi:hypothetical protein
MLYWGLGFLVVAVTALVLGAVAAMPGCGGLANVALLASLAFFAGGAVTLGYQRREIKRELRPQVAR